MHDQAHDCWVGYVLYGSCTLYRYGRLGPRYQDFDLSNVLLFAVLPQMVLLIGTLKRYSKLHPDTATGRTYAAEAELDEDDVICGDPWAVRVRAVNEMGQGPPEWYPTLVRIRD